MGCCGTILIPRSPHGEDITTCSDLICLRIWFSGGLLWTR